LDPDGRDELWIVTATPNAFGETCSASARGAVTAVIAPGQNAPLAVSCVTGFATGDLALVSNLGKAALLTLSGTQTATSTRPATLSYVEADSTPNLSNAPEQNGFRAGDWVYGARLLHFYVRNDASGTPGLYRAEGSVLYDPTRAWPFTDAAGTERLVIANIEDFQVTYGVLDANAPPDGPYLFRNGLAPAFNPALRAIRITAVARSKSPLKDNDGRALLGAEAVAAEDHTPASGAPAGYRRSVYTRRVELLNLTPSTL
jgi:hypothetical protein